MQKHLQIFTLSLFFAGAAVTLSAQDTPAVGADTVVATVNGVDITLGHMIAARATLDERFDQIPAQELYDGILQQLVQQEALAQQVEALPPMLALTLENEERSLKANNAVSEALEDAVSDADIQAAYDEQYGSVDPQEEYNAAHILLETEEDAIAVKEMLDGGANFAATAREKSTGPSGPNGGDLGWFGTGQMVPSFEAATIALDIGEVSEPVQTQFGWHIILLNDARRIEIPSIDMVRPQLLQQLQMAAANQLVTDAPASATVVIPEVSGITPEMIAQQELLDQ